MLINKSSKIDVGDVVTFKLVNGDEIMAKIVSETDSEYIISKPRIVIPRPENLGSLPATFTGNDDVDVALKKASIIMSYPTSEHFSAGYLKATTGIEILPQGVKLK